MMSLSPEIYTEEIQINAGYGEVLVSDFTQ
jgi:hypothetical protein